MILGKILLSGKMDLQRNVPDTEATDCVTMYHIAETAMREPDTNMYFQKIRAFSDFALDIPL